MKIYVILWITMTLFISYGTKNKSGYKYIIFAGGFYVIIAAFRDISNMDVRDIPGYYENFCLANTNFLQFWNTSPFEKGYTCYVWIMRNIVKYFNIFLIVSYGFIYYAHVKFILCIETRNKNCFAIGALLIGTLSAFYIFRIYLSISMFLIMLTDVRENKWIKAFLWAAVAISFHNAAIILIPILGFNFILNKKDELFNRNNLSKRSLISYILFSILIICLLINIVVFVMSNSSRYSYYNNEGSLAMGIYGGAFIVYFFTIKRLRKVEKSLPIAKTLIVTLSVVFLVIPLQAQYAIMYRMAIFFTPIICMVFCILYNVYKKSYWYYIIKLLSLLYFAHIYISFWTNEVICLGTQYIFSVQY